MSSRITTAITQNWDEEAYQVARDAEIDLNEKLQELAHSERRYTPTGRQSVPWAREYQQLTIEAQKANQERRRLGNAQVVEDKICMECHYAQILPAR